MQKLIITGLAITMSAATANAATVTWVGVAPSDVTNGANWDSGTSPWGGTPDEIIMGGNAFGTRGSHISLATGETLLVKDNATLRIQVSNTRFLRGAGSGGSIEEMTFQDNALIAVPGFGHGVNVNMFDASSIVFTHANANPTPTGVNRTLFKMDAAWNGSMFFAGRDTTFVTNLINHPDGLFILGGDVLTSSDAGTKYTLTTLTGGVGVPSLSLEDNGVLFTVVPEPGSLALMGLGGLLVATRRRRG